MIPLFLLVMCTSDTQVSHTAFRRKFENGRSVEVVREDRSIRFKGILTGADYGGVNDFQYEFITQPDEYSWKGNMNQVPVELIFCDDDTYLKVTERIAKYDSLYGTPHFKDTALYFKNVDDRYFFKFFGEQYFREADSIDYYSKKLKCKEAQLPVQ